MKDSTKPKVTIITVSYNSLMALKQTIENVLETKPYIDIDYIIIDGGSTDGTVDLLRNYTSELTYWVSEPDKGIYDAMNKGWLRADNDSFILYLGCGDKIVEFPDLNSFKDSVIIAGIVLIDDKYQYLPKTGLRLKLGNTLHHQALLVKKAIHVAPPFNTKYKTYADFDFNQRLIKQNNPITIDLKFKGYAMGGGVSSQFSEKESLAIVKKNFGPFYVMLAKIYYLLRHEIK